MVTEEMITNSVELAKDWVWDEVHYGEALFITKISWECQGMDDCVAILQYDGLLRVRKQYGEQGCEVICIVVPGVEKGETLIF